MGRYIAINITRNEKCVQGQSGTPIDSTVTQLLSNGSIGIPTRASGIAKVRTFSGKTSCKQVE